jgi:glutathione S-transferase
MKLYGFPMSPNTQRARFALEEVGVGYTFELVDLMAGAQREPAYLAINPAGRVPCLVDDDGFSLFESNAILVYLAAAHPDKHLDGTTPRERAEVARWMFLGCAHLGPPVQQIFAHTMRLPPEKRLPQVVETARADLDRSLKVLEQRLAKVPYLAGDAFSIADISVTPILSAAPMLGIDLSAFPSVGAWLGRVRARPAWGRATGM